MSRSSLVLFVFLWHSKTTHWPGGADSIRGLQQSRKHTVLTILPPPLGFLSASSVVLFLGYEVKGHLAITEIRAAPLGHRDMSLSSPLGLYPNSVLPQKVHFTTPALRCEGLHLESQYWGVVRRKEHPGDLLSSLPS